MQVQKLAVGGVGVRPPRLNLAGWCMWCTTRNCSSPRCMSLHAASTWAVCPDCEGSEYTDAACMQRCRSCRFGVLEVTAVAAPVLSVVPEPVESPAEVFARVQKTLRLRPQAFADRLNTVLEGSGMQLLTWRQVSAWKEIGPPPLVVDAALTLLACDSLPVPLSSTVVDLDAVTL